MRRGNESNGVNSHLKGLVHRAACPPCPHPRPIAPDGARAGAKREPRLSADPPTYQPKPLPGLAGTPDALTHGGEDIVRLPRDERRHKAPRPVPPFAEASHPLGHRRRDLRGRGVCGGGVLRAVNKLKEK